MSKIKKNGKTNEQGKKIYILKNYSNRKFCKDESDRFFF